MGRLETELSGLVLDNPIMAASGTFGYGLEFNQYYDINELGSFSCKGTTLQPRFGNSLPRIAECYDGMINSVGLQNPGVEHVVDDEFKQLSQIYHKKIFANISGFSLDEYVKLASIMDKQDIVGIIEVNVSCPNVHGGGLAFGTSAQGASEVCKAVKQVTHKPVYMKLSPNVTDIASIAKACQDSGADGIVLINTLKGMRLDLRTGKPILANTIGGVSGPCVFPVALACVYQVAQVVDIPIVGVGGITTCEDVIEMISAGASAVQIGSGNLVDPYCCYNLVNHLEATLDQYHIKDIKSLIGRSIRNGKN